MDNGIIIIDLDIYVEQNDVALQMQTNSKVYCGGAKNE
jgi:hypothetical protein